MDVYFKLLIAMFFVTVLYFVISRIHKQIFDKLFIINMESALNKIDLLL